MASGPAGVCVRGRSGYDPLSSKRVVETSRSIVDILGRNGETAEKKKKKPGRPGLATHSLGQQNIGIGR